jgi:hypothetical protein
MPTFSLDSFKKIYIKNKLKFLELAFLSLFLAFLPSLEVPKNIFLAGYLITALYRQSQLRSSKWTIWDWVFLSLIASSFLSALFPFIAGGSEWKGFRGMLLWITFGWTLFRSDYNFEEKKYLFIFQIKCFLEHFYVRNLICYFDIAIKNHFLILGNIPQKTPALGHYSGERWRTKCHFRLT